MSIDAGIYAAQGVRPQSVADYDQQNQSFQQNALNLQRGKQQLDAYTQDQAEKASLRNLLSGPNTPDLSTAAGHNALMAAAPTLGPAIYKNFQDGLTSQALAHKDNSIGNENDFGLKVKRANQAITDITNLNSPQDAIASLQQHLANGDIDQQKYAGVMSTLQPALQDPAQFGQWKRQMVIGIMDAKEKIAATAPKVTMTNVGGSIVPTNENADAGPVGAIAGAVPIKTTVSPDTAATTATTRRGQDMTQQTQYRVAGLDQNGNFTAPGVGAPAAGVAPGAAPAASPLDGLVDSIGTYGIKAETALSRMPPAQKAYVMSAIAQKYPDYDPMNYTERQAGIHSFAPNGNNGKTVQALNVSVDHLAKFRDLATALDNTDNQTINTVGNAISKWTGGAAPTNFEAAKNIVMDEVTKGVIGASGGQGDREKMAQVVASANSPKQLAGALDTITGLMGGRLDGVQKSYESSTGKKDFSTKYLTPQARAALERANGGGAAPPGVPDDIAAILAKHGTK